MYTFILPGSKTNRQVQCIMGHVFQITVILLLQFYPLECAAYHNQDIKMLIFLYRKQKLDCRKTFGLVYSPEI